MLFGRKQELFWCF